MSDDVQILSNPTEDEAQALVNQDGEARYLVDDVTKKVYFWNAEHSHNKISKIFKERGDKEVWSDLYISGVSKLRQGKFHINVAYQPEAYATPVFVHPDAKRFFKTDWRWAYEWLQGLEEDFERNKRIFLAKEH
jgi:hypothetical protein